MTWATDRRLDYIDLLLLTRGQVQRGEIAAAFGVSMSQASTDLREFQVAHSGAAGYDKSAKRYVPTRSPYRSRRGTDDPEIRRAIERHWRLASI